MKALRLRGTKIVAFGTTVVCATFALVIGTATADEGSDTKDLVSAVAVLTPTEGNEAHGKVTFTQTDDGVLIEAHIMGLTPGEHGFHIHQYGDISASDGTSAGGHFNPQGHDHAGPMSDKRHVGDLGNITADKDGHAMYKKVDKHVEIHGASTILSRAVVVHGGTDDLKSQPSGAAGPRVAVGVIGLAKPAGK